MRRVQRTKSTSDTKETNDDNKPIPHWSVSLSIRNFERVRNPLT